MELYLVYSRYHHLVKHQYLGSIDDAFDVLDYMMDDGQCYALGVYDVSADTFHPCDKNMHTVNRERFLEFCRVKVV